MGALGTTITHIHLLIQKITHLNIEEGVVAKTKLMVTHLAYRQLTSYYVTKLKQKKSYESWAEANGLRVF